MKSGMICNKALIFKIKYCSTCDLLFQDICVSFIKLKLYSLVFKQVVSVCSLSENVNLLYLCKFKLTASNNNIQQLELVLLITPPKENAYPKTQR